MTNDENDKWSDDGDTPINPIYTSEQLEEQSKKKTLDSQINDQKTVSKDDQTKELDISTRNKIIANEKILEDKSTKEQVSKEKPIKVSIREMSISKDLPYAIQEPAKDLTQENQELKNKLSKLKEDVKERKELSYLKELGKYIKNLESTLDQLTTELKIFTNAKSWEAISQGNLYFRRYSNYYDIHSTITTAAASNPNDFDSRVYNVEKVYESLERYAEIIYVANDGTDNLYVIVSHGGRTRFSTEAPIYPGEIKRYFNIYEIRLRSPTAGLPYRVTEYHINKIV